MAIKPVSVSKLNSYIKSLIGNDPILGNIPVTGEISNLTKHSGGHWYFSLKDESSRISCFFPKDRVLQLRFDISEGMKVTVYGSVGVYQPGGYYSLNIRTMEPQGEGALKQAFDNLKRKLESEGLFDESKKKPLPAFPHNIGVVTSPTGAAIRDIISTVKRRNPLVNILIYPCLVQGEGAAISIAEGINFLNRNFSSLDILIVGRGGGSAEDLWSFNEEKTVRAVADSRIPVISAVGHERDYCLTDFAADVRGATPTAAAELAVPHIDVYKDRLMRCSPKRLFDRLYEKADNLERKLLHIRDINKACIDNIFAEKEHRLTVLKLNIDAYNPGNQLKKGYAIVKTASGAWVSAVSEVEKGSRIEVIMQDGCLSCIVEDRGALNG